MTHSFKIATMLGLSVAAFTSVAFAAPLESGQPQLGSTDAPAYSQRQRAPGVPLAPTTSEQRGKAANQEASVRADRDIPMPRAVPSIIAR